MENKIISLERNISQDSRILAVCPNPSIDILAEVDQLVPGKVSRIIEQQDFPGGKGVHVALAIAEIAEASALLGFWGGLSGRWIQEECEKRNIVCYGPSVDGLTRTCYTLNWKDSPHRDTELLGLGPLIGEADLRTFNDEFVTVSQEYEIITMSGSWPGGVGSEAYRHLISLCKEKKVILDCSGKSLSEALEAHPYCIHINLQEGKDLFRIDDPEEIAKELKKHCKLVALTLGKSGLLLVSEDQMIHANVEIDHVISTVGSGDCLVGGLAIATANGFDFPSTAKLAVACGAANCLNPELGMLKRKDVEMLYQKATIKIIEI